MVEYYWLHVVIIKWLSVATAQRRAMHDAKKSAAGNVPFFHPGSRLAVRRAWISGCWFHPTGQAACEGEPARGGSSGGRGGVSGIRWMQNDSEGTQRLVDKEDSRNQRLMSDCQVAESETASFKCCIKHVASNGEALFEYYLAEAISDCGLEPCQKKEKTVSLLDPLIPIPPSCHLTVLLLPPRPHY